MAEREAEKLAKKASEESDKELRAKRISNLMEDINGIGSK